MPSRHLLGRRLKNETVRKIAVFAPFYDQDLAFLKMVKAMARRPIVRLRAAEIRPLEGKKLAGVLRRTGVVGTARRKGGSVIGGGPSRRG